MRAIPLLLVALSSTLACSGEADSEPADGAGPTEEERRPSAPGGDADPSSGETGPGGQVASNDGAQATETNFVPAVCLTDEECPPGVACVRFGDAGTGGGVCDVAEATAE